jgi:hypothetical protein
LASNFSNKVSPSAAEPAKPGDDLAVAEAPHLAGGPLDDGLAHGDLAVAAHDDFAA